MDAPLAPPVAGDPEVARELLQAALGMQHAARFKDADAAYQRALAADPALVPGLVSYGFFLCQETEVKNPGEALRLFRLARMVSAEDLGARLGEGITRQMVGDLERAEPLLRGALEDAELLPAVERAMAELSLGTLLYESGRAADARVHLRRAAEEAAWDPARRAAAYVQLAATASDAADLEAAEQALRAALEQDPEQIAAHHQLSRILARRGQTEEAAHHRTIHAILRRMADHNSARFLQDHDLRIELQRELVEAYPEYARAPLKLIRELLGVRRYADALAEVTRRFAATGAATQQAELYYLMARAQAGLGQLAAARASARTMRQLDRSVPVAVLRDILEEWKRAGASEAEVQQALQEWAADS